MRARNLVTRAIVVVLLSMVGTSAIGCNTIHGAGRDVERGGEKIQDAADRNR
ncbi:MAG TPA: entericidin A/B family lipoprotein [Tepidisphaeraceae bacterium]|nr:entericidin A/B family lipoprotein [Tepidisphaeraceae bacterium]